MSLFIENESRVTLDLDIEKLAQTALDSVIGTTDCPYEVQINLIVTDEEEIQNVNAVQRGIDRVTDVLSFPMMEFTVPGRFPKEEEYTDDMFDMELGELLLGDVVICAGKVIDQAREYGHSLTREFVFLLVHSFLHLCGYDHIEEEDREKMEKMQRAVMEQIGISRGDADGSK